MISLKSLINERVVKFDLSAIKNITFLITSKDNLVIFVPKTSKDLDLIIDSGLDKSDIQKELVNQAEKRTKLTWSPGWTYSGAGYAIELDMQSLIKLIN